MPFLFFLLGATFSLSPASGMYGVGEEFDIDLNVQTEDSITSVRAYLNYDPSLLQVVEIQSNKDAFPYWWEQESMDGIIKLQASVPTPGFQGEETIANIKFEVMGVGSAQLAYDFSSLALNAQDENILDIPSSSEARFTLSGQTLSFSSFPVIGIGLLVFFGLIAGALYFRKRRKK